MLGMEGTVLSVPGGVHTSAIPEDLRHDGSPASRLAAAFSKDSGVMHKARYGTRCADLFACLFTCSLLEIALLSPSVCADLSTRESSLLHPSAGQLSPAESDKASSLAPGVRVDEVDYPVLAIDAGVTVSVATRFHF
jgi:hypothetical protein